MDDKKVCGNCFYHEREAHREIISVLNAQKNQLTQLLENIDFEIGFYKEKIREYDKKHRRAAQEKEADNE